MYDVMLEHSLHTAVNVADTDAVGFRELTSNGTIFLPRECYLGVAQHFVISVVCQQLSCEGLAFLLV